MVVDGGGLCLPAVPFQSLLLARPGRNAPFIEGSTRGRRGLSRGGAACGCSNGSGRLLYRMVGEEERRSGEEAARVADRLHTAYPKIERAEDHREDASCRNVRTGSKETRQRVWRDLLSYDATGRIPEKWKSVFRSDRYGNVVSIKASNMSLCFFEVCLQWHARAEVFGARDKSCWANGLLRACQVDHIFPWSRGGLSEPANFTALHWGADRHVKNDKIVNCFSEEHIERMQCGLPVDGFLKLVAGHGTQETVGKRRTFRHAMEDLLCTCTGLPSNARAVLEATGCISATLKAYKQKQLEDLFGKDPPG